MEPDAAREEDKMASVPLLAMLAVAAAVPADLVLSMRAHRSLLAAAARLVFVSPPKRAGSRSWGPAFAGPSGVVVRGGLEGSRT